MTATAETLARQTRLPGVYRVVGGLGEAVRIGSLSVRLPNGYRRHFVGHREGPDAEVMVNRPAAVFRVLCGGDKGFAEAYMAGDVDTPDITQVVQLALANWQTWRQGMRASVGYRLLGQVIHALRPNTRSIAKRNIAQHYDLGNAFYAAWLDPSMTYSSAVFEHPEQPLEAAQRQKYAQLAHLADLRPEHHVLEIGCGWGGFAEFAAREIGCHVTALTISQAQHDFAAERIQRAGLSDRVEIRLQDYREVSGSFDRVASIEMFEAVGQRYWSVYFDTVNRVLKPGGRAAIQTITIDEALWDEYRAGVDFIQLYIFPGGMLPTRKVFLEEAARAGLQPAGQSLFGAHYARTLEAWHKRFDAVWPDLAPQGFDERFRRMWKYYLAYCQGGFETERIDVMQAALSKA